MECNLCGMPLARVEEPVWSPPPERAPYCSTECLDLAHAVAHSIPSRIDRAAGRDHSLCGVEPCSDCA
jgi:hypothetical protein